jgi:vacuole membrane protein 1
LLQTQKAKLHSKDGRMPVEGGGSILASLFEKLVIAMVVYFVVSIVNSLAQSYHERLSKKKHVERPTVSAANKNRRKAQAALKKA